MAKGQLDVLESLIRKELEAYLRENKINVQKIE